MSAEQAFKGADDLMLRTVKRQRFQRGPAGGGDAHQFVASPSKMMVPLLLAWMEQAHCLPRLGIGCHLSRSLSQRAVDAGQREIVQHRRASGNEGYHMIQMKGRSLSEL